MSGGGREALPYVRGWSGGPPKCPGVVRRPAQMSGGGRKTLPYVREWSGDHPGCLKVVGSPSRMSGSCGEALTEVFEALPDVREWS